MSDLTLLSKISNEAINDNLKKRFENGEIYVCRRTSIHAFIEMEKLTTSTDLYWTRLGLGQSLQRLYVGPQVCVEKITWLTDSQWASIPTRSWTHTEERIDLKLPRTSLPLPNRRTTT